MYKLLINNNLFKILQIDSSLGLNQSLSDILIFAIRNILASHPLNISLVTTVSVCT